MNARHQRNHECRCVFVSPKGPERGDAEAGMVGFVDNEKAFDAVDWVGSKVVPIGSYLTLTSC